ncbi:hypothetical protein NPA31_000690 [Aurantimonas sp. MSK8Z-1]|uniref:hypothetical protein n=1 Tax=Mangrovibrevibacter kandeliae TaxID=2968473 RepID=UPI0021196C7E|nr:hypothetical protein [Aurantimonas sp. MSK8Z-1]MCW4113475.1 hypothetical protein [Aurantimonas sp. MSK8Z-1]
MKLVLAVILVVVAIAAIWFFVVRSSGDPNDLPAGAGTAETASPGRLTGPATPAPAQ